MSALPPMPFVEKFGGEVRDFAMAHFPPMPRMRVHDGLHSTSGISAGVGNTGGGTVAVGARAKMFQHKNTDRRRQIAALSPAVDLSDQIMKRVSSCMGNFSQIGPEGIFEADAGLVGTNGDATFRYCRLHGHYPFSAGQLIMPARNGRAITSL